MSTCRNCSGLQGLKRPGKGAVPELNLPVIEEAEATGESCGGVRIFSRTLPASNGSWGYSKCFSSSPKMLKTERSTFSQTRLFWMTFLAAE